MMQEAGIPNTLCGYADLITAWEAPERDRGGALYMALTDMLEHYRRMQLFEQNMLNTSVRRTSRLLSSIHITIQEIEHTLEMVVVPMLAPEQKTLQFFSMSEDSSDLGPNIPDNWRKVLSNFYPAQISVKGYDYPTSEHAFHAAKALYSSKPSMAQDFIVGGSVGPSAWQARRAGGEAAYTRNDAVLYIVQWMHKRDEAQKEITASRIQQDPLFASVLTAVGNQHVELVHFDRSGSKSYWGGVVDTKTGRVHGKNRLGVILTEEARKLASK
jgi:predicted NAD-dependent protein-ADP-ribosyltransferase YbiA (DUF1768 family)